MDTLCEKALTNGGIPYYINHLTERTQWDHPEFIKAMEMLDEMSTIHFASYRAAVKLRTLQKVLNLDFVELSTIDSAFTQSGFRRHDDGHLDVARLHSIIYEMFSSTAAANRHIVGAVDVDTCTDLLLNWVLNLYDMGRTGTMRVLSAKTCMAALCASRLTEKYQYLYKQLADRAGGISRRNMTSFLRDLIRMTDLINESATLGRNAGAAVTSCFATVIGSTVSQDRYMSWLMAEPQTIVWLPTMHRLATAESMKHEAKCNICKMAPIVGLRFKCLKCLNYDMCQNCFFVGMTTKKHRLTHPTQEYIFGTSSKEDIRAFAKTIRNKLSKKHGRRVKLRYLPIDDADSDVYAYNDLVGDKVDMHVRLGHISKKLAAMEEIRPAAPPSAKVTPSPDSWTHPPTVPSTQSGRASALSGGTSSDRSRERRDLEDLIDILEKENEELVCDIQQLAQRRTTNDLSDEAGDDRDSYSDVSDADSHDDDGEMMQVKQAMLEEQNHQLEMQLRVLKDLLKQNRSLPKASTSMHVPSHSAFPPPYHAPPTRGVLDQTAPPHLPSYQTHSQHHVDTTDRGHAHSFTSTSHDDITSFHQSAGASRLRPSNMTNQSATSQSVNDSGRLRPHFPVNYSSASESVTDGVTLSPPVATDQSVTAYQSQQTNQIVTPPSGDSTAPLPSYRNNQSAMTPGTFASKRLLPAHLTDQSTVMFPNLSASRMFPPEEAEMNKILQRLNQAYPMDAQDEHSSPEMARPPSYAPAPTFMRTRRPPGTRDNPVNMIDAVARIGDAMTTLVARVTDRPSGL